MTSEQEGALDADVTLLEVLRALGPERALRRRLAQREWMRALNASDAQSDASAEDG